MSSLLDETIETVAAGLSTAVYQHPLTPRAPAKRRRKRGTSGHSGLGCVPDSGRPGAHPYQQLRQSAASGRLQFCSLIFSGSRKSHAEAPRGQADLVWFIPVNTPRAVLSVQQHPLPVCQGDTGLPES